MPTTKKLRVFLIALFAVFALAACGPKGDAGKLEPFSSKDVVYFLLTDRFHDANPDNNFDVDKNDLKKRHGGDFKGVLEKVDYLKAQGATAVWLTPVQKNTKDGYHGYWIDDYHEIEPHLGTMDELKEMVKTLHDNGIKVILDFVVNHTGYDSQYVKDPAKADWFHEEKLLGANATKKQQEDRWLAGLPDWNTENEEVRAFLLKEALWLIEETGIDGFRLDTVVHVPMDFWEFFVKGIQEKHPDFFFLGEVYNYNASVLKYYQTSGIEGMLNYPVYDGLQSAFTEFGVADTLKQKIKEDQELGFHNVNGTFIDNHDNPRFLTAKAALGEEGLKNALSFLMTYTGIPIVYYGTEIGMEGGADPDNRRDMTFDVKDNADNNAVQAHYQKLLEIRKSIPSTAKLVLEETDEAVLAFKRVDEKTEAIHAVYIANFANEEKTFTLPAEYASLQLVDQLSDKKIESAEIRLAPRETLILTPAK